MMKPSAVALIAAPPDSLRYSLRALLAGLPLVGEVRAVEDAAALLAAVPQLRPGLIVLDINLVGEAAQSVLAQIKATTDTRVVVLVDFANQQANLQAAPIDLVVVKGHPAADLFAQLERLLVQPRPSGDY